MMEQHSMAGFAFVDDMDLIVNDPTNKANKVHGKMQQSLALWDGLLQATREDFVFDKCFWYLLDFHWENNKLRYKMEKELPGKLLVKDKNQQVIIIP